MTGAVHSSIAGAPLGPARAVHAALARRRETLAVAESLTGGLVAAALTDVPGASATFRGALVVYATDLKASIAAVPADLLASRGPVDPDVAMALAAGVARRLGTDWGLALTGVAGPDPQGGQPVGTVYAGVTGTSTVPGVREWHLDGDRSAIRTGAVVGALRWLLELLDGQAAASL